MWMPGIDLLDELLSTGRGAEALECLPQANTHTHTHKRTQHAIKCLRTGGRTGAGLDWREGVVLSRFKCGFILLPSSLKCPPLSSVVQPAALRAGFGGTGREQPGTLGWSRVRPRLTGLSML